ncbi:MAG: transcription antitermination factor NusB [Egibacteraceae bacterium]
MTAPSRGHSRHVARKQALDVLYEADLKDRPLPTVLAEHLRAEEPPADFAVALVRGVHRHGDTIDALITEHAHGWTLSRMPVVDRNLLRIGLYEILHDVDVPTAVAINEAVELAKELSTDDSGRFVNGLLARIAETHPPAPA